MRYILTQLKYSTKYPLFQEQFTHYYFTNLFFYDKLTIYALTHVRITLKYKGHI